MADFAPNIWLNVLCFVFRVPHTLVFKLYITFLDNKIVDFCKLIPYPDYLQYLSSI